MERQATKDMAKEITANTAKVIMAKGIGESLKGSRGKENMGNHTQKEIRQSNVIHAVEWVISRTLVGAPAPGLQESGKLGWTKLEKMLKST